MRHLLAGVFCLFVSGLLTFAIAQVAQVQWPQPFASGGIAFVQKASAGGASSNNQIVSLSGVAAHDMVVLGTQYCQDSSCVTTGIIAVTSVTDTGGDTCAQVPGAAAHTSSTVVYEDIWYCQNVSAGAQTFTVNYSGTAQYHTVYVSEWSGALTSSPVDGTAAGNLALNPGSSPSYTMTNFSVPTSGNVHSGDLVYSIVRSASGTITAGNNALSNAIGGADEYQIAGAAGAYLDNWTLSASPTAIVMGIAAFKPASGGGALPTNSVTPGAFNDAASGSFETPMEAWETWLGASADSNYSIAYGPYAFDCVGGGTSCMTNTGNFYNGSNYWFPTSRQKVVWSIPLTGCDHAVNLSGALCTSGHTIPLTGTNSIASGFEDTVFNSVFSTIAAAWPNAIIRIGWEMNLPGSSWTWGVGGTGGSTTSGVDYVSAFQHVAALAHAAGLRVDWCPGLSAEAGQADNFYPGDAYVDIIGMDFYDFAGQDLPFYQTETFGLYWHAAFAHEHGKPMAYDEWGCGGTDSTDTHCQNIINSMGSSWLKSEPVLYFNFFNSQADLTLSKQICDNGTAGNCGTPYQNPLSAAAFLSQF